VRRDIFRSQEQKQKAHEQPRLCSNDQQKHLLEAFVLYNNGEEKVMYTEMWTVQFTALIVKILGSRLNDATAWRRSERLFK
jgi:hypothetical protein